MNWASWLIWGFAATAVLTTLMAGSEGLGVTRMNIPHMLGTMFTPNRDRARVYGVVLHFLNGWAFSIVYVAAFHAAHLYTWWFGMVLGVVHSAFIAAVVLPVMPGVHPRMASELRGPTVARQLEPPGFLALHYGVRTPISVLVAHLAFGAILGGFYSPRGREPACRGTISQAAPAPPPDQISQQVPWPSSIHPSLERVASRSNTIVHTSSAEGSISPSGRSVRPALGEPAQRSAIASTSMRSVACWPASTVSEPSPPTL